MMMYHIPVAFQHEWQQIPSAIRSLQIVPQGSKLSLTICQSSRQSCIGLVSATVNKTVPPVTEMGDACYTSH